MALKKRDHLLALRQQHSAKYTTSVYYYEIPFSTEQDQVRNFEFIYMLKGSVSCIERLKAVIMLEV